MSDQAHWDLFWSSLDVIVIGDASRLLIPWPLCATRAISWDVLSITELLSGLVVIVSCVLFVRQRKALVTLFIALLFWHYLFKIKFRLSTNGICNER